MNHNSTLYIHQEIETIQGEGDLIGVPSILLRLAGCNCRCPWCDTPWSWGTKNASLVDKAGFDAFLAQMISKFGNKTRNLMITGGEPLLYKNNKMFHRLLNCDHFETIEIETNGSLIDKPFLDSLPSKVKLNISPKLDVTWYLPSSEGTYTSMLANLRHIKAYGNYIFKFVNDPVYQEVMESLINGMDIDYRKVYIMPLTPNRFEVKDPDEFAKQLKDASLVTLKYCVDNGYHFVPRLHLYLWDDENEDF